MALRSIVPCEPEVTRSGQPMTVALDSEPALSPAGLESSSDPAIQRLLVENSSLRAAFDGISQRLARVEDEKSRFFDEGIFDLVNSIAGKRESKTETELDPMLRQENAELRRALEQASLLSEELEKQNSAAQDRTRDLESEQALLMERLQRVETETEPGFTHEESLEIKSQLERMRRMLQMGSMECAKALSTQEDDIISNLDDQVQQLQRKLQEAEARASSLESENVLLRGTQLDEPVGVQPDLQEPIPQPLHIDDIDEAW